MSDRAKIVRAPHPGDNDPRIGWWLSRPAGLPPGVYADIRREVPSGDRIRLRSDDPQKRGLWVAHQYRELLGDVLLSHLPAHDEVDEEGDTYTYSSDGVTVQPRLI
jgi:hypothetical protein